MSRVSEAEASAPTLEHVTRDQKLALVARITATVPFERSERLVSFLLHICRMEADGKGGLISEQQIGHAVFGRSRDYDPGMDGIVRSHASRLRLRLDQYFETEGKAERVRISIPRGAYVPVYQVLPGLDEPSPAEGAKPAPLAPIANPEPPDGGPVAELHVHSALLPLSKSSPWRTSATVLLAMAFGFLFATVVLPRLRTLLHSRTPSEIFWAAVFPADRTATLVVGDAGVNMFENMARRQVSVEEYSARSWLNEPMAQTPPGYTWVPLARRSYTPWFVVPFASRLAQACEARGVQFQTISARDLTLDAVKNGQLVLIGGPEYNPWELLLATNQNFLVSYDGVENSISIQNRHPEPGEPPIFKWQQTNPASHSGYSLISFARNLKGNGHILSLAGTTAQGDEAAAEFLLDSSRLNGLLERGPLSNGKLNDFEAVLKIDFMAGGSVDSHVVALRVHP